LATNARAVPPLAARCCFETMIGAACARFVVKTAATEAGWLEAMIARSRPFDLMPQSTPLALKPAGAVTPPSMGV
jgi:hypothetical protein